MRLMIAAMIAGLMATAAALAADEPAEPSPVSPGVCRAPTLTDFKMVNDRWPDASTEKAFAEDVVRLSGAKTDQDKALALWQWIRRVTMKVGDNAPSEPSGRYVDDPVKILNVFSAHHCDGLSRVMQNAWRALGYPAQKYYRNGHTYADCWWVDDDGVGRYHTFDMNYGWFCFTRDGSRLATGEEIGTDFSLFDLPSRTTVPWIDKKYWMWSWVHAPHVPMSTHDVRLNLHAGDRVERQFGSTGRLYQMSAYPRPWDDPEPRPYPWTPGSGVWRLTADFGPDWQGQLAAEPVNAAVRDGRLVQADPARPAEVIYRIRTPYIIADADLALAAAGAVELALSSDAGRTWKAIPIADGTATLTRVGFTSRTGPIGRYDYLIKATLTGGASISALTVDTVIQHNFLALPVLLPGDNRITLSGNLPTGRAVEVTYVWDDASGQGLTHKVKAAQLPYSYTIRAAGQRWQDVRGRTVIVTSVANDAEGSRVMTAPPLAPLPTSPMVWTDVLTLNGPKTAPPLRTTAEYLPELKSDSEDVRRAAVAGLIIRRDPAAWDELARLAFDDITVVKYYAVQALHWTDAKRAWPILKAILEKDGRVKFPDIPEMRAQRGMWLSPMEPVWPNMVALIAALCAEAKTADAVPLLSAAVGEIRYPEPKWAILRSLGTIGDPRARQTVRRNIASGRSDHSAVAIEAAARLGDTEAIPLLKPIVAGRYGYAVRRVKAIEALGLLGADDCTDIILPYLTHEDEDLRAAAAEALGRIGEPTASIPAVDSALKAEAFAFVRSKMEAALEALRARTKA